MPKHITKAARAYKVEIFMAGNITLAQLFCEEYCNEVGLCVTVTPTTYVFTGGQEEGFIVGLINYARFATDNHEKDRIDIWSHAMSLADRLKTALGQGSYTVQNDKVSHFYSEREVDVGPQS